ncbi:MAG: glutathione S-transferase [Marinobacter sp.]
MPDYELFYWDLPFRGNFIQLFLEEVRAHYQKLDASELYPDRNLNLHYPGMAPPYLYDRRAQVWFAQMPAILMHLAKAYEYLPDAPEQQTLALKVILDCDDVLMEITNHNGMMMWDQESWNDFRAHRLANWMTLFERTGQSHSLKTDAGYLLGPRLTVADIATVALFGTLVHSFPELAKDLEHNAPRVANLCQRVEGRPAIAAFLDDQRRELGNGYCGGQIEQSLRDVIG